MQDPDVKIFLGKLEGRELHGFSLPGQALPPDYGFLAFFHGGHERDPDEAFAARPERVARRHGDAPLHETTWPRTFSRICIYKCYTFFVNDDDVFDWDAGNEGHVLAHGVEPGEVEEALLDPDGFGIDAYDVPREQREALIGATEEGRILLIVYTVRGGKVRPITARDASGVQKKRYRRGRG